MSETQGTYNWRCALCGHTLTTFQGINRHIRRVHETNCYMKVDKVRA